jgi:F420-dependent oxidoreductase-like protein
VSGELKLGLNTGYWAGGPPPGATEAIAEAEKLGFESVWTAEAYGSDCLTPLAWWGSQTERIQLGTGIVQMSARQPAATAMAAMTLDHLSGGRFILGLGASGPQVVEGWYGQPYPKPLARTREYVEVVRKVVAREAPVEFHGQFYDLPLQGGAGLGKALKPTIHPYRTDIPIYLGAEGPKNIAMTAEIADGWLPIFFAPRDNDFYKGALQEGFDREGARRGWDDFEIPATTVIAVNDDVEAAAEMMKPFFSLYIGGMGAKDVNFHFDVFARMGYEAECQKIQELYLEGRKDEATAMVPTQMVDDIYLIGPKERIREKLQEWDESVVTTLLISGPPEQLRLAHELVYG